MKTKLSRNSWYGITALSIVFLSTTCYMKSVNAAKTVTSSTQSSEGLKTTTFQTPYGNLKVNMPDDMSAEDTLSGTVIAEPAGDTDDEKQQNEDQLNGYVVELKKTHEPPTQVAQNPPSMPSFNPPSYNPPVYVPPICGPSYIPPTHTSGPLVDNPPTCSPPSHTSGALVDKPCSSSNCPPGGCSPGSMPTGKTHHGNGGSSSMNSGSTSTTKKPNGGKMPGHTPTASATQPGFVCALPADPGAIDLVLKNPNQSNSPLCTESVPYNPQAPEAPPEGKCSMPTVGQCGHPIPIKTRCGGDMNNSSVKMGGKPIKILAEGPRGIIAQSPHGQVGPTDLTVQDGNKVAHAPFTNLRVKLSCPKPVLQKGESTTVTVQVWGTENLTEPVTLTIDNKSPDVVELSGGNHQEIPIGGSSGRVKPRIYE